MPGGTRCCNSGSIGHLRPWWECEALAGFRSAQVPQAGTPQAMWPGRRWKGPCVTGQGARLRWRKAGPECSRKGHGQRRRRVARPEHLRRSDDRSREREGARAEAPDQRRRQLPGAPRTRALASGGWQVQRRSIRPETARWRRQRAGPRIGCVTVFQPCRRPACLADRWILAPERKAESSRSSGLAIDVVSGHLKVDFTALRGTCGPYRTGFAHRKNDEISAAQTVCRSDDGLDRHQ